MGLGKNLSNIDLLSTPTTTFQNITLSTNTSSVTLSPPSSGTYILTLPPNTGTNNQVLTSNGIGQTFWQTPVGTVSNISATIPPFLNVNIVTPTTTPVINLSLSGLALPTLNGGTGLTTVGTEDTVLTSNGTSLSYQPLTGPIKVSTSTTTVGTAVLGTGGLVVVPNTVVTADTLIFMDVRVSTNPRGFLSYTIIAGTSFTMRSSNAADRSTIGYVLIQPV